MVNFRRDFAWYFAEKENKVTEWNKHLMRLDKTITHVMLIILVITVIAQIFIK